MQMKEYRDALDDLSHPDPLQQIYAALWLLSNLPVYLLGYCSKEEINKIAAPVKRPE